jgi:hypothetical protein
LERRTRRGIAAALTVGLTLSALVWAYGVVRHYRKAVSLNAIERVGHFQRAVERKPTAANWRGLAEAYAKAEMYERAPNAYMQASKAYGELGDHNAAVVLERQAQRYETDMRMYFHRTPEPLSVLRHFTGARLEPVYGAYIGAFIDHEDDVKGTYRDEYGTWRRDVAEFNEKVGVPHGMFFMYLGYGRQFPAAYLAHMKKNNAAAQIAWEPKSLAGVKDDEYLHGFARKAKECGVPIFLRFASEMNGNWVPYHGDPDLYKQKFQLVARVMHEEAPNVAMVWCVFESPQSKIEEYYPGPEAVDWVGVNVYSVLYYDNDSKRNGQWRNPADGLRFVYGKYAEKHPIMVCEYAASHMSSLDMVPRPEYAADKLAQFYASLPRLYPRVKAVNWLSMNAIKHAMEGRQRNDYALLDDDSVRHRYRQMVVWPYFLREVGTGPRASAREEILDLKEGQVLRGKVTLSAWVKTYIDRPSVIWRINGQEIRRQDIPGAYHWTLDTTKLPNGTNTIELEAFDPDGRPVGRRVASVEIAN